MLQDLHSHTYYSFCGKDSPEAVVEAAIAGGIAVLGISDHNYGIGNARLDVHNLQDSVLGQDYGRTLRRYYDHINLVKEKYANRIRLLRGIEICTLKRLRYSLPETADISFFDYCLIENIDAGEESMAQGDLFGFAERCGCKAGVAHTDLFAFIKSRGEDPLVYFRKMAERGIFWEMNVSYDSIHQYREHSYMLRFFENEEEQEIVRRSGVEVSVGFDGHKVEDYLPARVADYCHRLEKMGIPMPLQA